jgi:hypothetical protein
MLNLSRFVAASRTDLNTSSYKVLSQSMFILLLALSSFILSACGSSGHVDDRGNEIVIDGHKLDSIINKSVRYNVYISGTSNNIVISEKNQVGRIRVTGVSNDVTIRAGATVDQIDLEGEGNTLYIPKGLVSRITKSGFSNKIVER